MYIRIVSPVFLLNTMLRLQCIQYTKVTFQKKVCVMVIRYHAFKRGMTFTEIRDDPAYVIAEWLFCIHVNQFHVIHLSLLSNI